MTRARPGSVALLILGVIAVVAALLYESGAVPSLSSATLGLGLVMILVSFYLFQGAEEVSARCDVVNPPAIIGAYRMYHGTSRTRRFIKTTGQSIHCMRTA